MNEGEKDMEKAKRLKEVYRYVFANKGITSQTEFANKINVQRTAMSAAMNGKKAYLTNNFFTKICAYFPELNIEYLLNGKGTLLIESSETVTAPIDKQQDALTYAALQIGRLTAQLEETLRRVEKKEEELTARLKRLDDLQRRIEGVTSFDMVSEHPKKIAEP